MTIFKSGVIKNYLYYTKKWDHGFWCTIVNPWNGNNCYYIEGNSMTLEKTFEII